MSVTWEYTGETLNDVANYFELRANEAFGSIGPDTSKLQRAILQERAVTWHSAAHIIRNTKLTGKSELFDVTNKKLTVGASSKDPY